VNASGTKEQSFTTESRNLHDFNLLEAHNHLPSSHNGIPLGKKRNRCVIESMDEISKAIGVADDD
jgi:hypothetical protein